MIPPVGMTTGGPVTSRRIATWMDSVTNEYFAQIAKSSTALKTIVMATVVLIDRRQPVYGPHVCAPALN
jgi:hypothetical protein